MLAAVRCQNTSIGMWIHDIRHVKIASLLRLRKLGAVRMVNNHFHIMQANHLRRLLGLGR